MKALMMDGDAILNSIGLIKLDLSLMLNVQLIKLRVAFKKVLLA